MKCKVIKSVLFHRRHLQEGNVFDFTSEAARELTEKGFVKPIKLEIQELEAMLEDESIPKVVTPVLERERHPAEKADLAEVARKTAIRKARADKLKAAADVPVEEETEEETEEEPEEEMEEEEAPEPKKTTAKKKTKRKRG